jgi:hypothetical protein
VRGIGVRPDAGLPEETSWGSKECGGDMKRRTKFSIYRAENLKPKKKDD